MEYRALGRTGVQVSALCLGCMMFGGRTGPEESAAIIDRALDAGINFLDTANVYGRGRSGPTLHRTHQATELSVRRHTGGAGNPRLAMARCHPIFVRGDRLTDDVQEVIRA